MANFSLPIAFSGQGESDKLKFVGHKSENFNHRLADEDFLRLC
jgi:hypothetical protein